MKNSLFICCTLQSLLLSAATLPRATKFKGSKEEFQAIAQSVDRELRLKDIRNGNLEPVNSDISASTVASRAQELGWLNHYRAGLQLARQRNELDLYRKGVEFSQEDPRTEDAEEYFRQNPWLSHLPHGWKDKVDAHLTQIVSDTRRSKQILEETRMANLWKAWQAKPQFLQVKANGFPPGLKGMSGRYQKNDQPGSETMYRNTKTGSNYAMFRGSKGAIYIGIIEEPIKRKPLTENTTQLRTSSDSFETSTPTATSPKRRKKVFAKTFEKNPLKAEWIIRPSIKERNSLASVIVSLYPEDG